MFVRDNKVETMVQYYMEVLEPVYGAGEARSILNIVFKHFKKWDPIEIKMNALDTLSESELLNFHWFLKRLKNEEPVQHVLGYTEFYGLELSVNEHVLIPRPETEELVDLVSKEIDGRKAKVLDVGTGSGCIPIALKFLNNQIEISGIDVSSEAIKVAELNAENIGVDVKFSEWDVFSVDIPSDLKELDYLISNPPYIPERDKDLMSKNVLDYEPHLALFVDDNDPLVYYKEIAKKGLDMLKSGGELYFEIHEEFGPQTKNMLEEMGYTYISIIQDLNQKDRIVNATR